MKTQRKKRKLLDSFSRITLDLPSKVYDVNRYAYPHSSPEEAMRGDWERIGKDFHVAIERAYDEAAR